jgi:SAM-dependent methyltransferase
MLADYQQRFLKDLQRLKPLAGMRILEIGGDLRLDIARELIRLGAQLVWVVNLEEATNPEIENERIKFFRSDAAEVSDLFPLNCFDIIVGCAVLEHIQDLPGVLSSVTKVLQPGGSIVLSGGPLWSSAKGHHLWLTIRGRERRFNDDTSLLPDFAHLLHDSASIGNALRDKFLSPEELERVAWEVYFRPYLSRQSKSSIIEQCDGCSGLQLQSLIEYRTPIEDHELKHRLGKVFGSRTGDCEVDEITVLLHKKTNASS